MKKSGSRIPLKLKAETIRTLDTAVLDPSQLGLIVGAKSGEAGCPTMEGCTNRSREPGC